MGDTDEHEHDDQQTDEQTPPPKKGKGQAVTVKLDELRELVRDVVDEVVGSGSDDGDGGSDDTKTTEPAATTPAAVEHHTERSVAEQVEAVLADRAHAEEHERLKTPPQPAPKRERKLTRMLWGGGD